jgi:starch synthase (maltosyl-transferring)
MDFLNLPRVVIEQVSPLVDGGRYPIKRTTGDRVAVSAAIFKDGHDLIIAEVCVCRRGESETERTTLHYDYPSDLFSGEFTVNDIGLYDMWIEAWPDYFGSFTRDLKKRLDAGQDIAPELLEGAALVRRRARHAPPEDQEPLANAAKALSDDNLHLELRQRVAFSQTLRDLMHGPLSPRDVARSEKSPVRVDRREAAFAAWYELFPRSQGTEPGRHGTFKDTELRIPEIAAMGFEVIYLPPIHPIGTVHRKGRNNTTTAEPGDVGSPWAIGSALGGHTAVHPELGTLEDFRSLVRVCREYGIEIALDFALQCAPDHPWVKEHPDWFFVRPDGTIRYAENPPKRYEDIYPLNFWGESAGGLWVAARDALFFWIENGVKTFRVDNPHTKPLAFWEWCINEVQEKHPEVLFLSESFTRPNRMKALAKLGFTQSYTYFTWKNSKAELVEYLNELTKTEMREYYRPNFFANTPDILHEYLQHGGRPAFRIRLLLAATLAPVYGIYSGFELCENVAVRPGSEEYLDSEKYEIRVRDWNAEGNIKRDVSRINAIRSTEPALSLLTNLEFVPTDSNDIIAYIKRDDVSGQSRHLLVVVNVNPQEVRETMVHVPVEALGLKKNSEYRVKDLLTAKSYTWRGEANYVRLDPEDKVGHLFRIEPLSQMEPPSHSDSPSH